jgi:aryl sulfotransferase
VASLKGIVWVASYPKSGNTWFRLFVDNLRADASAPVHINDISHARVLDRSTFDQLAGVESTDLAPEEIDRLRPRVYETIAEQADGPLFAKVHDAYRLDADRQPLFTASDACRVVYIVRNPLDVCVSLASHAGTDVDVAIRRMEDDTFRCEAPWRFERRFREHRSSWSGHVASWLDAPLRTHVLRYEDMKERPFETLSGAVRFLEMDFDRERIRRAIRFSSFEELRQQEERHGFAERQVGVFFRRGEAGGWREVLSAEQVERVVKRHGDVMRRLGYL